MKLNIVQNKGLKLIIATVMAMIIATSAVYAVNSTIVSPVINDAGALKNSTTEIPGKDEKTLTESEVTYDKWQTAMEQSTKKLPRDQELALYNQGYDFYDIEVAENLAGLCEKTPQELLTMKGKTTYTTDVGSIKESSKPWSDIVSALKIKLETPTQALGISSAQIDDMKQQGLSEADIEQVAILSFNYKKDYHEILKQITKDTNIESVKKKYWQTRQDDAKKQEPKEIAKANTEKLLKKQYNITDDDIKKCGQGGLTNIVEIAIAKDIAIKNNIKLDQVLQIENNKKNWQEIRAEAGGK